jgi:hypothetical protein
MEDNIANEYSPIQCTRHGASRGINIPFQYFVIEESFEKGKIVSFEMHHYKNGEIKLIPIREEKEKPENEETTGKEG